MSRKTDLAKNTAILTVGKLCTQCISFFLLPLYTALLATEEYGTYDLLITYSTLLLPIVNWQFDQGMFRFMLDFRNQFSKQQSLFSTLLTSSLLQSLLYVIVFLIVMPFLTIPYAGFLLIYVVLHVFTALLLQFVRGLGSNVKYTVASFISASSTTVLNVIMLVGLKMGLLGLFVSTVASQVITIIYLIFATKCWKYFSLKYVDFSMIKVVGAYSVPLIPNNLAWWVVNASDRIVIERFINIGANGIYSVANKFPSVFIQFFNILHISWTETVLLHFDDEDRDQFFSETMTSLFKLFNAACVGIIACMPFVFPILVDEKYHDSYYQIPILMYAMLFRVLVGLYSCIYVAEKKAKKIAATSITAAIINLVVDLLLVNKIKLYAASVSTLVAFLSMFIVRYIDINKQIKLRIKGSLLLTSFVMGAINLYSYYLGSLPVKIAVLLATVIYSAFTNWDMVKSGYNIALQKLGLKKNKT